MQTKHKLKCLLLIHDNPIIFAKYKRRENILILFFLVSTNGMRFRQTLRPGFVDFFPASKSRKSCGCKGGTIGNKIRTKTKCLNCCAIPHKLRWDWDTPHHWIRASHYTTLLTSRLCQGVSPSEFFFFSASGYASNNILRISESHPFLVAKWRGREPHIFPPTCVVSYFKRGMIVRREAWISDHVPTCSDSEDVHAIRKEKRTSTCLGRFGIIFQQNTNSTGSGILVTCQMQW